MLVYVPIGFRNPGNEVIFSLVSCDLPCLYIINGYIVQ